MFLYMLDYEGSHLQGFEGAMRESGFEKLSDGLLVGILVKIPESTFRAAFPREVVVFIAYHPQGGEAFAPCRSDLIIKRG